MKFLPDWRRPEERDDIFWIEDDSKHEHENIHSRPVDTDSRETWITENITDPPEKGWSDIDFAVYTSEIPRNTVDLRPADPEDVVWIDDDSHGEPISRIFSSEPSASKTFAFSYSSFDEDVENEGTYYESTLKV